MQSRRKSYFGNSSNSSNVERFICVQFIFDGMACGRCASTAIDDVQPQIYMNRNNNKNQIL